MALPSTRLANPQCRHPAGASQRPEYGVPAAVSCPRCERICGIREGPRFSGRLGLTSQSIWLSGVLIIGGGTLLSVLGPVLVRRYVALDRLTINNEIAGFKFATVGVLYAVLLAFVIIVVWEKLSDAEVKVVNEAGAAENIYRLSQGLGDVNGGDLRKAVASYLKAAI